MKIDINRFVSLVYELREANSDGRVIEHLEDSRPMTFIYGSGRLLPAFEANLQSLKKGDEFRFRLESAMAYGERSEDMIIDVPVSVFQKDGKIDEEICQVGNEVPMTDRDGNRISGTIIEITDKFIKMDFNHPMADTDLYFTGKILDVREATDEELAGNNHSCSSCGGHDHKTDCSGSCS
jgi:FKBP-type peptidyl-prolyl cis-trans isomerase SlyD